MLITSRDLGLRHPDEIHSFLQPFSFSVFLFLFFPSCTKKMFAVICVYLFGYSSLVNLHLFHMSFRFPYLICLTYFLILNKGVSLFCYSTFTHSLQMSIKGTRLCSVLSVSLRKKLYISRFHLETQSLSLFLTVSNIIRRVYDFLIRITCYLKSMINILSVLRLC